VYDAGRGWENRLGVAQQSLQFLLTDAFVIGAVGWIGLLVTLIGLSIAIQQIRQVKTAAEAAASAAQDLAKTVRSRERLLELATAKGHLENASQHIVRREFALAGVFIDLAINECVQIKELVDGADERGVSRLIVRLRKLSEALIRSTDEGTEDVQSVPLAVEAKEVRVALNGLAAKMRYQYVDEE